MMKPSEMSDEELILSEREGIKLMEALRRIDEFKKEMDEQMKFPTKLLWIEFTI